MEDHQNNPDAASGAADINPYGRAFTPDADYPFTGESPKKRSGFGIASFVMALSSVLLILTGMIIIASVIGDFPAINDESFYWENGPEHITDSVVPILISIILYFGGVFISLVGLILGIIGAVQKNRRKTFAIIGIVLNGLVFSGAFLLFIVIFAFGATFGGASSGA